MTALELIPMGSRKRVLRSEFRDRRRKQRRRAPRGVAAFSGRSYSHSRTLSDGPARMSECLNRAKQNPRTTARGCLASIRSCADYL